MPSRRSAILSGLAAAALAGPTQARVSNDPEVQTRHGPVIGFTQDGIKAFKGVRYGAPPRRFHPPERPATWRSPLGATAFGPPCPQRSAPAGQDEDCLFLNVWTPGTDQGRRPVMVWLHGGAYSSGSASHPSTDGARLAAKHDVVVVSLNHRLNLFGYAYLKPFIPSLVDSGNVGQLDILLGLQWVRDNIAAFGGDPARVMVFGQSGGGAKIATLMAMPSAKELFHSAATMSGQQVTASGPINARKRTKAWLAALGLNESRAHDVMDLPVETLLRGAEAEDPILGYGGLYFGPVLDNRNLLRHPFYPDASPLGRGVPMIIGNCREETLGFMGGDPNNRNLTWDTLASRLTYSALRIDIEPEPVIAAYRAMHPDWTPDEVLIRATTAGRSWRAAVIQAEERAKAGVPAWVYQMDFPGRLQNGREGAFHGVDVRPVFDTLEPGPDGRISDAARRVSDQISGAFAALAARGDPNHPGIASWRPYELTDRATLIFDSETRMENDPRGDERRFFAQTPYIQPGT